MHCGNYEDTYVRAAEGWQFASRRFHLLYKGAMDPGKVVPVTPRSS